MVTILKRKVCGFQGCKRKFYSRGLCRAHYSQLWNGKPLTQLLHRRPNGTDPVIVYNEVPCKVLGLKGPCHECTYSKKDSGYGQVKYKGRMLYVHRYVWERKNGPIPKGLLIDHKCRNRACCNVNHLRVVTYKVNQNENVVGAIWQIRKTQTHCKHGHKFTKKNTYLRSDGGRKCKKCGRKAEKKYAQRKALACA